MLFLAQRNFEGLRGQGLAKTMLKVLVASTLMALAVHMASEQLSHIVPPTSLGGELLLVGGAGGIGLVTYGLLVWLLQVEEIGRLRELTVGRWLARLRTR